MIELHKLNNGDITVSVDVPKYTDSMEPGVLDIQTYKTRKNLELEATEQWFACVELIVEENGKLILMVIPKLPIENLLFGEIEYRRCLISESYRYGNYDTEEIYFDSSKSHIGLCRAYMNARNLNCDPKGGFSEYKECYYMKAIIHEPVYDMTLDEIEKKLGKKIRIINNDKDK